MTDQPHPIVDRPWTYVVAELHVNFASQELVMTLRKGDEVLKLRFTEFQQLAIDEGYTGTESGMEILDFSSSGMERARIRVQNSEPHRAITFWARDVERIQE